MIVLITKNRWYADLVVQYGGRPPRDIGASCVLEFIDQDGSEMHAMLYGPTKEVIEGIRARAQTIRVRWAHPAFHEYFPELFEAVDASSL